MLEHRWSPPPTCNILKDCYPYWKRFHNAPKFVLQSSRITDAFYYTRLKYTWIYLTQKMGRNHASKMMTRKTGLKFSYTQPSLPFLTPIPKKFIATKIIWKKLASFLISYIYLRLVYTKLVS